MSSSAPRVDHDGEGAEGSRGPEVSVVIPAFNEEENLEPLAALIRSTMDATGRAYEVIFIDDGSTDGSRAILEGLSARDARVRIASLDRNMGQSAALVAGFRLARGSLLVTLDADLQNDPRDIPLLLDALGDHDMVSGVRQGRREGWRRRWASRIANTVRRRALGDGIQDVGCSLKVYRADVVAHLPGFDGLHRFLPALVLREGGSVREVPVSHGPRRFGVSKYSIAGRLRRGLVDLAGVAWLCHRWLPSRALAVTVHEPEDSELGSGDSAGG